MNDSVPTWKTWPLTVGSLVPVNELGDGLEVTMFFATETEAKRIIGQTLRHVDERFGIDREWTVVDVAPGPVEGEWALALVPKSQ